MTATPKIQIHPHGPQWPHEGGCAACYEASCCNGCGVLLRGGGNSCTNGRCAKCHNAFCGSGGDVAPGHYYWRAPVERVLDLPDASVNGPTALDALNLAIIEAVMLYDASGDHRHAGSPVPGDCIRCNVVNALHPWAQRKIEAAVAARKATR